MFRPLIIFLLANSTAFCQQLVEGRIIDRETGAPVPFASVGIVGTAKGTSSNIDGQFLISVTEPFSLKVSCVGYESLVINSLAEAVLIKLNPAVTQLSAIVILAKPINAKKILRKTFSEIAENYDDQPFLQKFFYRHYCKDGDSYGRLIEASVDVWKNRGYRYLQKEAGENEEIRVTQLRRSFDKTDIAQGHEPISVGNILQADVVGYQTEEKSDHLSFYTDVSNLKTDLESYSFTGLGITFYDGLEVYQINYSYKKDSVLMTSGAYQQLTQVTGTLYITTDSHTIIKSEETKSFGSNTIHTSAYYQKFGDKYYPYHFVRDGETLTSDNGRHVVHIELMAVEIRKGEEEKFTGGIPGREELLNIPFDSAYWTSSTILKTTPLEDKIIRDLGGGTSLNQQFYRYHQLEMNVRDGGKNGEEKFNWLREDSRGSRILYLIFWSRDLQPYLKELELAKRLRQQYRDAITFVFLSLDDDEATWRQAVQKYSFHTNGIINYRIGSSSQLAKLLGVKETPDFILFDRYGKPFDLHAKRPSNVLLKQDFDFLVNQK